MEKHVELELARLYIGERCGHALSRLKLINHNVATQDDKIIACCPSCIDASGGQTNSPQRFCPTGVFVIVPSVEKLTPKPRPKLILLQGGKSNKHY